MSEKLPADESNSNEEINDDSDPGCQQRINDNRANVEPFSKTTLQDLPFEMLECILVRAVVMEVMTMKLRKEMWKENADLVISRLRTVCSQWDRILTTKFFRKEVHRILDQETIRLEVLHEFQIPFTVFKVIARKDEIFLLCRANGQFADEDSVINVCEHNNVAITVKDVIPLLGMSEVKEMAACNVSDCLYVIEAHRFTKSVFRITKDGAHQYSVSEWLSNLDIPSPVFAVSPTGGLVFVSWPYDRDEDQPPTLNIYSESGALQHRVTILPEYTYGWMTNVFHKLNGNLVLVTYGDGDGTLLTEVDARGSIVRQYKPVLREEAEANFADNHGRIWISDWSTTVELVDSEFKLLDFANPQMHPTDFIFRANVYFNSERNEIVRISHREGSTCKLLTILRFT